MLRTDVYVTADLYQAEQQDMPRIDGRYKETFCCLYPQGVGGELPYERGADTRRLA